MEITMNSKDIENLLNEMYDGISKIQIDEKLKIVITTKSDQFLKKRSTVRPKPQPVAQPSAPVQEKSLDEKNQEAVSKGAMASGGRERTMAHF